jgi:hypothetical protein
MTTVPVYRAPMRSRRDDIPQFAAVGRALEHQVVGVGGRLESVPGSLAEAVTAVAHLHGERLARRLDRFASAPDGAFVWTRDSAGSLWLGRMAGAWRFDSSPEAQAVDLVHVRPCRWLDAPVPDRLVPPAVHATFSRGGRNWQQTHDEDASKISAILWDDAALGEP